MERFAAGRMAGCTALLLSLLLGPVTPVLATTGVSVDLGRIDITEQLSPGGSYNLPTLGVRNPGTERTRYAMIANGVNDADHASPRSAWFHFEPASLTLDPGESRSVRVRLVVPTDAEPGDYIALIGAQIVAQGTGASVGAAAAARTTFTVRPANEIQALTTWLGQTWSDLLPWSAIVPLVFTVILGLWVIRRRFTFGLRVERR